MALKNHQHHGYENKHHHGYSYKFNHHEQHGISSDLLLQEAV